MLLDYYVKIYVKCSLMVNILGKFRLLLLELLRATSNALISYLLEFPQTPKAL